MPISSIPTLECAARTLCRLCTAICLFAVLPLLPLNAQDFSHPETQTSPSATAIQQANDALAASDFPTALKILTTLNSQTPHNPQILYDLGLTIESLQPNPSSTASTSPAPEPTAEFCYRGAIAADATFPPPRVALGLLLARTGRTAEARTELLAATAISDIAPALKARAFRVLAHIDLDGTSQPSTPPNPVAASADLLAALKLTPEQPEDVLLSAAIAEAAADLPAAEQAYHRFLALPGNASNPQAVAALAHLLLLEHRPADAEALLIPALAANPGNPSFTAELAEAYLNSGDKAKITQATPLIETLQAKNPANGSITRLLARIYVETGHPEQADSLYAALLAAQSDHPDPTLLDDRAAALLRLQRPGEAEKLLKQAVANPAAFPTPTDFADAATHLAFAATEIDDPATALHALDLRATVLPPSPASLFLQATANDDLHHRIKAAEFYKQFLAAAQGSLPDQETQARKRLAELEHTK